MNDSASDQAQKCQYVLAREDGRLLVLFSIDVGELHHDVAQLAEKCGSDIYAEGRDHGHLT